MCIEVNCKFHTKIREKRVGFPKPFGQDCSFYHVHCVSKRGKVRIKVIWTKTFDFIFNYNEFGA